MKKLLALVMLVLLAGCGGYETVTVTLPDGFAVKAKLADTPEKTERGLMFVKHLPEDEGMLFVFDREDDQVFWMKNTLIDLDMIFIAPDQTVNQAYEQVEHSYTYTPDSDVAYAAGRGQYVLELPAKSISKHGIKPGSALKFELPEKK